MSGRNDMWGPMSLEEYAEKLGEDLSRRPMPLTGLEDLPDMGALRAARKGDSISSILGSSDPAAIGAFMEANGMKDSRLRVGESYLIPRRADLADTSMAGRGQAALHTDNARAAARARSAVLPSDAVTARPGAVVFDPHKGHVDVQKSGAAQPGAKAHYVANSFEQAGYVHSLFDVINGAVAPVDGGHAAKILGRYSMPTAVLEIAAKNGARAYGDIRNGEPAEPVIVGAVGKAGAEGLGLLGGAAVGGALGAAIFPPAAPFLAAAGGFIGATGMDKMLTGSNTDRGRLMTREIVKATQDPNWY